MSEENITKSEQEELVNLQTYLHEAIIACNDAIEKLCRINRLLKIVPIKRLIENSTNQQTNFTLSAKQKGDPLAELQHNVKLITDKDQLVNLINKLKQEVK